MREDIFGLLMLILLLENGGGTENVNQLIIMFLLLHSRGDASGFGRFGGGNNSCDKCGRDDGFTF